MMRNNNKATDLERDLARHLQSCNWIVWTQIPLGPIWGEGRGVGIADVMAILKSFANKRINIYEIKVSRGDYLADVNTGKYEKYFDSCAQFYFAVPSGLVSRNEVPDTCGLITKTDTTWQVVKAAPRHQFEWSETLLLKLLMRGYEDYFPKKRQLEKEIIDNQLDLDTLAYVKGNKLAKELAGAQKYIEIAKRLKGEVEAALGTKTNSLSEGTMSLQSKVRSLMDNHKYLIEAVDLAGITMQLFEGNVYPYTLSRRLRGLADKLDKVDKQSTL